MATKEEKGLQEALIAIQKKLKAPKDLYNKFGNFNYRSAESILEAVKPLLAENGVLLLITDEIVMIGTRYYVKSTATVQKDGETRFGVGYAREDDSKKGMDGSQVTGASSSYARKYALNGLFLIDDTKDADTDEYRKQQESAPKQQPKPSQPQPAKQPQSQSIFNDETELVAEQEMLACNSYDELMAVWSKYNKLNPQYCRKDGILARAFVTRNNQLKQPK
jgi:hypothetical protein